MSENIQGIIDVTLEKIRAAVDADLITGKPIEAGGVTVVPISKLSLGVISGGSDFPAKSTGKTVFGGGGGAGVSVTPVTFLVISGESVRLLPVTSEVSNAEKIIDLVPEIVDKVSGLFGKKKNEQSR